MSGLGRAVTYLSLRLLHLQVWRISQQVSGQLHRQPARFVAVAVSVKRLSAREQNLVNRQCGQNSRRSLAPSTT